MLRLNIIQRPHLCKDSKSILSDCQRLQLADLASQHGNQHHSRNNFQLDFDIFDRLLVLSLAQPGEVGRLQRVGQIVKNEVGPQLPSFVLVFRAWRTEFLVEVVEATV